MNDWKEAAERIVKKLTDDCWMTDYSDDWDTTQDILETINKILTTCASPVSREVAEALKTALTFIENQKLRYGYIGRMPCIEDQIIAKLKQALAHVGTCRCDCEKYRELLGDALKILDNIPMPTKESYSQRVELFKKFDKVFNIKRIEPRDYTAAPGAEEEEK